MSIPTPPEPQLPQAAPQHQPQQPVYQAQPQAQPQPQAYIAPQPQLQPRPQAPTTLAATNTYAVVAVILAFIQPIAGIVFGHLALSQIKRTGDGGRGLALTGLLLGYIYIAFILLFVIFYVSMIAIAIGSLGAMFSEFGTYDSEFGYN